MKDKQKKRFIIAFAIQNFLTAITFVTPLLYRNAILSIFLLIIWCISLCFFACSKYLTKFE